MSYAPQGREGGDSESEVTYPKPSSYLAYSLASARREDTQHPPSTWGTIFVTGHIPGLFLLLDDIFDIFFA